jgi:hypothetical protein
VSQSSELAKAPSADGVAMSSDASPPSRRRVTTVESDVAACAIVAPDDDTDGVSVR